MLLKPLPVTTRFLSRYRLKAQRHMPSNLLGSHIVPRKGQSLKFREYNEYVIGDDIRHIDWRTSARIGRADHWIVKKFDSEEHFRIVISIDTRDSMRLPEALSKLQIAAWIAEAIARIALINEDEVVLHRLFGPAKEGFSLLRGTQLARRIGPVIRTFSEQRADEQVNLLELERYLPPSAIWIILTDLYFGHPDGIHPLARRITQAQQGWRWIILVDLDTWNLEEKILGTGPRRVIGPTAPPNSNFDISVEVVARVRENIEKHKRHFLKSIERPRYEVSTWQWPTDIDEESSAESFFINTFPNDDTFQRIFWRGL
jgi:hypothetical protein